MVASPAPDIFQQSPDAFLGLQWWEPTPGALPKWTWVKPCSQGSPMTTCSPSSRIRIRFYPALDWFCNIHYAILEETACHHQLWSPANCAILSTCCMSWLHGTGLSLCLLLHSVIPVGTLHGVRAWEGHPGHLTAGMREVWRAPWFSF